MHCVIQKAEALDGNHLMQILWNDGAESLYPAVWLRDNCQCSDCYLDSAKARKLLLEALDVNIGIKDLVFDRKKSGTTRLLKSGVKMRSTDFDLVLAQAVEHQTEKANVNQSWDGLWDSHGTD
ncbi:Gamma-butyrobetaine dioxygenase [Sciurus carolinensis]|uniref:Gamma-butyrobetaine dioxygenase n=1 Tax=Sciurus carolinensis TaxID=30640 RepID=A0AA41MIW7_SCICA|nr:Gamma-butyrobetaine dioxygenase [Sciurus carolinensis]